MIGSDEGMVIREKLIKHNFVDQILVQVASYNKPDKRKQTQYLSKTAVWFFSQVLRGPPYPDPSREDLYNKLITFTYAQLQNNEKDKENL